MEILWVVLALASWWIGSTAAGVRRELRLLAQGQLPDKDYSLISLLRRLEDDPVSLALRLRLSRVFAAVFLPLGLSLAGLGLTWKGAALAAVAGWMIAATSEAVGGGLLARRLGRLRGGAGYGIWARITQPSMRLARPLLQIRTSLQGEHEGEGLVHAEFQASLISSGGRLGREERRFLRRLLASTTILVADVLVRWDRVQAVDVNTSPGDAAGIVRESGHSRLPVMKGDRVVGLISARDLVPRIHGGGNGILPGTGNAIPPGRGNATFAGRGSGVSPGRGSATSAGTGSAGPRATDSIRSILRPVYFVRQEVTVQALFDELQEARVHLAVVVDRLGRKVGIVTMEDVLEEIVGEIHDERERPGS
jgi:CBS domain-containing protein